jgi:hypothetical protein
VFEELRGLGYEGSYDAVRRYAKKWRVERGAATAEAYVPLSFAPGEAFQFDWSHEIVLINGTTVTVKVAHDRCVAYARVHKHPELIDRTIWSVFEAERAQLVPIGSPFDGFHATQASVSKTCLVRFDNNRYSVSSRAVGRPVEIQAYADRIVIRQDGAIVGEHRRRFGRGETIYDPWHYVPVLARKPGALRNGAPFKDWPLPASLERVRRKLKGSDDGDRQMVKVLAAVLTDGLAAVEAACAEALGEGVHSADVILNILARRRDPGPTATILAPEALRLHHAPIADCARYDRLRRAS